ncbi:MAG: class I SAM-dependent methyltransferase [Geminicoccaceae bacterium]
MKRLLVEWVRRLVGYPGVMAQLRSLDSRLQVAETGTATAPTALTLQSVNTRLDRLEASSRHLSQAMEALERKVDRHGIDGADLLSDLIELTRSGEWPERVDVRLRADQPVALTSPDHTHPRGTRNDNTRSPRFVRRCEQVRSGIRHLDIGCAGGGLVWDFAIRGHFSIGLEGSDYSLREQRAMWRLIPDRLFTADVRFPYRFEDPDGAPIKFNLVTAWEFFEHIPTGDLDATIKLMVETMTGDGLLIASVATFGDADPSTGVVYHHTVQEKAWWMDKFRSHGLVECPALFDVADFVRGSGNPRAHDWNAAEQPGLGFHVVLRPGDPR